VVKVLDGCAVSNTFWVFAGGLTNVQTTIQVTDTATGASQTYSNPQSTPFAPIQDTSAFATCAAGGKAAIAALTLPPATGRLRAGSGTAAASLPGRGGGGRGGGRARREAVAPWTERLLPVLPAAT
jgi:hypothetical protein